MFVINKHLTFSLHGSKWLFSSHLFFPNFSPPRSPGLLCFRINVIITISFTTESHEPWIFNAVWDSERKRSLPGEGREHRNPTFWKKPRGGWHFCSQQSDTINSCLGEHWPQLRCDTAALTEEPAFIYQDETSLFKHWDHLQGFISLSPFLGETRALHYPQSFISFGEQHQEGSLAARKTCRAR